ncbi:hypothetical protein IMSHALPRED_005788 [Imshaugia aleurites]|uniref:Uncharacterized protein n=1 Tax=Imshaugia aleurites TaxID=172621 RepID=A0A8H3FKZ2_9LECA|nr:hypothetical protein IMSHALPRED_005788 [Imshaugia aleurites]
MRVPTQNYELENEQPADHLSWTVPSWTTLSWTAPSTASISFRQSQEEGLRLFEAAEAKAKDLGQCVEVLQEEKSRISEDLTAKIEGLQAQVGRLSEELEEERRKANEESCLQMEHIAALEIDLESSRGRLSLSTTYEVLQEQNDKFQDRIEVLQKQLEVVEREKKRLSRAVGTSSKGVPASSILHKEYVEDLKKDRLELVKKLEEREGLHQTQVAQLQQVIDDLEKNKTGLQWQLEYYRKQQRLIQEAREFDTAPAQDLSDARAEIERLQKMIEEQQATTEQNERIEGYTQDCSDLPDSPFPENSAHPQEELDDLAPPPSADELEGTVAEPAASDLDESELEQPKTEVEAEVLRLQCQELKDRNQGLQEQDIKWRKLFRKFMHRAGDVQRKDASKHQIKKGFKDLQKIVKEGGLQDL